MDNAIPQSSTTRCVVVAELRTVRDSDFETLAKQVDRALAVLIEQWPSAWLEIPRRNDNELRVSAILASPGIAFDLAVALNLELWPQQFRVHVSQASHASAWQHLATSKAPFSIDLMELSATDARLLEAAAQLHATMMRDWKPSRAKAAIAMRTSKNQNEAAARLGIRQQSVSEALRAGHAKELIACEHAIRAKLEALSREQAAEIRKL